MIEWVVDGLSAAWLQNMTDVVPIAGSSAMATSTASASSASSWQNGGSNGNGSNANGHHVNANENAEPSRYENMNPEENKFDNSSIAALIGAILYPPRWQRLQRSTSTWSARTEACRRKWSSWRGTSEANWTCSWRWRLATRKCRSVLLPYLFSSKRSNVLLQRLYTRTNEQLRRDLREISEKIADMQEDLQVLDMYDMGAFGTIFLFSSPLSINLLTTQNVIGEFCLGG